MAVTRLLRIDDARVVASLLRENRDFLARWHPRRHDDYFTEQGQRIAVETALAHHERGSSVPLVITHGDDVVGMISIQSIIRGFLQSCSVGFWLAERAQGRGLATLALQEAVALAFEELRLHRVQAETLPENGPSQAVLARVGFVRFGLAHDYLMIDGRWRDHLLFQLLTPQPERVAVPS